MGGTRRHDLSAPDASIAELVAAARSGDSSAARALYDRHTDAVTGFCLTFARGDRAAGLDLAQDSFTTALASLDSLTDESRFSGWLMTITRRTCLQWAARQRRERDALVRFAREPAPARRTPVELPAVVAEVIEACPDDKQREVARRFYIDPSEPVAEIAVALGVSTSVVTSRLYRFRAWAKTRMLHRLSDALEDA